MNRPPRDGSIGWPMPTTVPQQMPDRKTNEPEVLVVARDGRTPLIQRVPRALGFRPPKADA